MGSGESRRNSRYIPGPRLPFSARSSKSPVRQNARYSYSPERNSANSVTSNNSQLEGPFNFPSLNLSASSLQQIFPQPPPKLSVAVGTGDRASFRKGHRYKHSSVSMNFFQEPEVKIPLNIAKSLPIPDFEDLKKNLIWPKSHIQITLTVLEACCCLITFQLGQIYHWNNFTTLSHFILYDVLGAIVIILVDILQQFEVWNQGTITFPFGLNRLDVILSFAQAITFCYVGLDLFFHILEEVLVELLETKSHHEEIDNKIPHSHHNENLIVSDKDFPIWYSILLVTLILAVSNYLKTFQVAKNKSKTNNPLITSSYIIYLLFYPLFPSLIIDHISTVLMAFLIFVYGFKIAKWTSKILLLGFQPPQYSLENIHGNDYANVLKIFDNLNREIVHLPAYSSNSNIKNFQVFKVNFNMYVVLLKLEMVGGSDQRETELRISIDKLLRNLLAPNNDCIVESTIEISLL
ncbi:related to Protein ZRG17 [Saccharomycodes ludwigii]|uniref:Related to Protein ZRG17 n=2 Tax=Saccharomycodes ludwigii TaxID=36035 RepID=A0A376BBX4_9ASCO|nr:related to Protein ZRG17 [Saccharomycodes ludwigii]